jgi:hypothetical protein
MTGNVAWPQPVLGQVNNLLANVVGQGGTVDESRRLCLLMVVLVLLLLLLLMMMEKGGGGGGSRLMMLLCAGFPLQIPDCIICGCGHCAGGHHPRVILKELQGMVGRREVMQKCRMQHVP